MIHHKMPKMYDGEMRGFTLIELLIGIAVLAIAFFSMFTFFISQYRVDSANQRNYQQQQQAMYLMGVLVKDIREAGYMHAGSGSNQDIKTAEKKEIKFYVGSNSSVSYEWKSDKKLYQTNETFTGGKIVFPDLNITTLSFRYYNSSGAELSTPVTSTSDLKSIRRIDIYLAVQPETSAAAGLTTEMPFSASVRPRNLGLRDE